MVLVRVLVREHVCLVQAQVLGSRVLVQESQSEVDLKIANEQSLKLVYYTDKH